MPRTCFDIIYQDLKNKILNETFAYESFLPTEVELTKTYSCSRNTLRRALTLLSDEALLQPIHGKGVRVIWQKKTDKYIRNLESLESFQEYAQRNNLIPTTDVKIFENITCTESVSQQTGFKPGDALIHIKRIRKLNGISRQIDNDYLLASAAGQLTAEDASVSIYAYLENVLKMRIQKSKRNITIELATEDDYQYLSLGLYNCVAAIESHSFNSKGIMFGYTQTRRHPETFCYNAISKRNIKH